MAKAKKKTQQRQNDQLGFEAKLWTAADALRNNMDAVEHKRTPWSEFPIFGFDKTGEAGRLCRMNLSVHGSEVEIRHGGNVKSVKQL